MVADTIVTDTKKITGPNNSSEALNITIEGQDSIFWITKGKRLDVGTSTSLILRRKKNPWEKMNEKEFIDSVKKIVPNPPFLIEINTNNAKEEIDEKSFSKYSIDDLKGNYWDDNENLKSIDININKADKGFVGTIKIGLLEMHDRPIKEIHVKSTEINIDNETYTLEKKLELIDNEIRLLSDSITVDDDGEVNKSHFTSTIAESRSKISLYGIEVPMSLFPESWERQNGQAILKWPFPMLIILDVCGNRELDLNSARSQILNNEKWLALEEELVVEVCTQLRNEVSTEYWENLLTVIKKTKNGVFLEGLKRIEGGGDAIF
jgi:hypothetical protein